MLDIMKAIYDMMGKCTYPVLKEETPRQHVEVFFQAGVALTSSRSRRSDLSYLSSVPNRRWTRTKTAW